MQIEYLNEHLAFGQWGNALIVVAFTAALLSAFAYFIGLYRKDDIIQWRMLARNAFYVHGVAVISIFGLLFYLIHNHYFEYYYVWEHSSTLLPVRYMWACFWEGQEGSFLLWTFWHVVLCFFLIRKAREWEFPVLGVIMLVQVFLCSMVLGLEFNGIKIGSNPFILLRNQQDFANLPFIHMPDYLSKIKDGRGLNPLLQNYWMVIHPPTLFLGFASTVVPFAFAMGGLLTGKVREWVKPALPWAFFSVMILGTGILMGGAWAYEALSFGGFWAWDPVENASLVPWLTLIGAAHVMIINKKNGQSLMSSFILTTVTFLLVLYSTFLTRSGILGDTSVHAFTDLGMSGQLVFYMAFFVVMSIILLVINRKKINPKTEEEKISSREFWMFMGMLVLLISAIQITITTSIPVINKVFGTKMAPPADAIDFYNSWQVPIAIIVALLSSVGLFFKWKETDMRDFLKKILVSLIISIIGTIILQFVFDFSRVQFVLLAFACLFAFIANLDYFLRILKGNFPKAGASIAHMGIALILLGALIANAEKHIISRNMLQVDLGKDFPNKENILLYRGDTLAMGDYYVTYTGKHKEGVNIYYTIDYYKANHEKGKLEKAFSLTPLVQLNPRMGNVSEPATKRFINKDIYTHITYAELEGDNEESNKDAYKKPAEHKIKVGDTLSTSNSLVILTALNKEVDKKTLLLNEDDIAVEAQLTIIDVNKKVRYANPVFIIKGQTPYSKDAEVEDLGLKFSFANIIPDENKIELNISEKKSNSKDFIIMKAIIFPQINILWTGCILMIIGTFIAIRKRFKQLN